jgi:PAS domain S-box-containing protein
MESETLPDETTKATTPPAVPNLKDIDLRPEGTRFILVDPAGTIYSLKKTLMQDVGFFEKDFLYRAGVAGARESLSFVDSKTLPRDPRKALEAMLDVFAKRGYGTFTIQEIDLDKRIVRLTSPDTAEGWSFQRNNDLQREPVCAYARGMLAFVCGAALLGDIHGDPNFTARETECIGAGAKECVYVVGPMTELVKLIPDLDVPKGSFAEHELRLNEEILVKNLELQGLNLDLERQVRKRTDDFWRSEENYESVMRQSPDPIALITTAGKLTHLNSAGLKMLGYDSEDDVLDVNISSILLDREHGWEKIIWTIEKEGRAAGLEMALVDKGGRRLTSQVYARFAELAPGRCVEAIFKDVTEQKAMEEQIREARLESDFLNDLLSHDIINYTVSALHFLGSVRKNEQMTEDARKKLDVITRDIQGAVDLAISVRDLARVKMADQEPVEEIKDLQLLLAEAIEESRMMYFDRNTKFDFQRSTEPRFARVGALVSRLFANLITNSIKYDQHEVVTIEVMISDAEHDGVQYWRTEIADHGIGIPDSDKKQVFVRFRRGNTKVAGTGLGLFVAASIAKASGGQVWAEDRVPGDSTKGTKMVVLLPKADARQIAQLRTRGPAASKP